MSDLVQLIYASHAAFEPQEARGHVDHKVARILMQSRRNNPKDDVGGALYYGDGSFFQCLEGERTDVDRVFDKISKDPRHRDIKVLACREVDQRQFSHWSMKFVSTLEDIQKLLKQRGFDTFDPHRFDESMSDEVLGILSRAAGSAETAPKLWFSVAYGRLSPALPWIGLVLAVVGVSGLVFMLLR